MKNKEDKKQRLRDFKVAIAQMVMLRNRLDMLIKKERSKARLIRKGDWKAV